MSRWASSLRDKDIVLSILLTVLAAIFFWPNRSAWEVGGSVDFYALPAYNLSCGRGLVLTLNGRAEPLMYPLGLPLLLCPIYAVLGKAIINGIYLCFAFGVLSVWLTFRLARGVFGRTTGVLACLFLISSESLRLNFSGFSSESTSTFLCLSAHLLLLRLVTASKSSAWGWLLLGNVLGFAIAVRMENVLLTVPAATLFLSRFRARPHGFRNAGSVAAGILAWGGGLLFYNHRWTGEWFRTGLHIYNSAICDRPEGTLSLRHLWQPTFRKSYLFDELCNLRYQWGNAGWSSWRTGEPVALEGMKLLARRVYYCMVDLFLVVGVGKVIVVSKRSQCIRDFGIWSFLWIAGLVGFLGCTYSPFDQRHLLRVVPYLCVLDAVGFVCIWNAIGLLPWRSFWRLLRARHARLYATIVVVQSRLFLCLILVVSGGYMVATPPRDEGGFFHAVEDRYLQHIRDIIPDRALVISQFDMFAAEHYLTWSDIGRVLPLHRFVEGADWTITLHRPPHPEWIAEDITNRAYGHNPINLYGRMFNNGSVWAYPLTAVDNPDVLDAALTGACKVYLVSPGVFTSKDGEALKFLLDRFAWHVVEQGFRDPLLPDNVYATNFFVAEILSRPFPTPMITIQGRPAPPQIAQLDSVPLVPSGPTNGQPTGEGNPAGAASYESRVIKLVEEGKLESALEEFHRAAESNPRDIGAHINRAFVLDKLGRYEEAIDELKNAQKMDPKNASVYLNWGNSLINMKKYEEALQPLQMAADLNPSDQLAYVNLGVALTSLGRNREGALNFERALQLTPNNGTLILNLAMIRSNLGDLDKAVQLYGRLIEIDPGNLSAYYNCAAVYEKQGNLDAAIENIRAAIKIAPDNSTFSEFLSHLLATRESQKQSAGVPSR